MNFYAQISTYISHKNSLIFCSILLGGSAGSDIQVVSERLTAYRAAVEAAKSKGESSKVRRYDRAISSMNQMMKDLKAGKRVNMDDLPPEVSLPGGGGSGPSKPPPQSRAVDDDDDLAELAEWAGHKTETSTGMLLLIVMIIIAYCIAGALLI